MATNAPSRREHRFGVDVTSREDIPEFFFFICEIILEKKGEVGIFRKSGDKEEIEECIEIFDDVDEEDFTKEDILDLGGTVHVFCSVLMEYARQMKTEKIWEVFRPWVTPDNNDPYLEENFSREYQALRTQNLGFATVLETVVSLLHEVSKDKRNMMNSDYLGIILATFFFEFESECTEYNEYFQEVYGKFEKFCKICGCLVEFFPLFFKSKQEEHKDQKEEEEEEEDEKRYEWNGFIKKYGNLSSLGYPRLILGNIKKVKGWEGEGFPRRPPPPQSNSSSTGGNNNNNNNQRRPRRDPNAPMTTTTFFIIVFIVLCVIAIACPFVSIFLIVLCPFWTIYFCLRECLYRCGVCYSGWFNFWGRKMDCECARESPIWDPNICMVCYISALAHDNLDKRDFYEKWEKCDPCKVCFKLILSIFIKNDRD